MGRLIDADALIKEYPQASGLKLVIENAPTAYDVEKVVAELEEVKVNTDTVESRHHNMIIDICADIVKRGGCGMSTEKCSYNWESECAKLREEMTHREEKHIAKENELRYEIEKLKNELMIYEQKWSVIQLIFGK